MFNTNFLDVPALRHVGGTVQLPGSKSISNRALLMAALCPSQTRLHGLLDSDDTRVMQDALRQLGCTVQTSGNVTSITGMSEQSAQRTTKLFLGNAGTAMRPLVAALAVLGGDHTLSGVPRMHERPIGDLVDALQALGARIDYLGEPGFPPLRIGTPSLKISGPIRVRGDVSSQFLTALLMALPLIGQATEQDITVEVDGPLISQPYIAITVALLAQFGVQVTHDASWQRFTMAQGCHYQSPGDCHIEADASSASYFIAAGALAADQTPLTIDGLGEPSIQGDIRFIDAARQMGANIHSSAKQLTISRSAWPLKAITLDANHIPDAAMTLAVMALYGDGPSTFSNIASWRVKETDRLAAMHQELTKLGAKVEEGDDWLRVYPIAAGDWRAASLRTYDDHRMAMCASLAAFNPDGLPVRVLDPACVAKTFPDYFETLFAASQPAAAVPVICVDGPTASGKGTLAARLAQALGYHHLDSGALYRLAGLASRERGLNPQSADEPTLAKVASTLTPRFADGRVWLGDRDVTDAIRTETAGMDASCISALAGVRQALLERQRHAAVLPGLIADGRDMGTVVFPNAPLKVFLTADVMQRAMRRHRQLLERGNAAKIDEICADLQARDVRDQSRQHAPLMPAPDALSLDNSSLSIDQSVDLVLDWWQDKQPF